ncbi:SMI1/KNR4 family protein [Williamsia maris]|uniref:SMI1 / KNR4 family (SUKH-1) n=1 Tax=Williamsia maris TaxID=72806 RepID=A0ABT1HAI0_9NOCA|nr:SMI1/KNR4 family protein [Williamsia maris]MCP2175252.1 SMI1 / KNR4 family (SUKH-1) [Williamsia maris]
MTLSESWASYVSLLTDRAPRTAAAIRAPRSAEARQKADFSKVPWNGDLREFFSLHDGQPQRTTAEADAGTVLPQLWLLGIDEVVEAHSRCRQTHFYTDHLGTDWPQVAGAEPASVVVSMFRDAYVPFASTGDGNYLCVDTGPGEHHGCVREFGLEFAVWRDLPVMQAAFALMEALTGVRVTLDLLRESTYLSLDIPLPTEPAVN